MSFLEQLFGLDGRTVVLSGAAGYFGQYMAAAFLGAGARVVLVSRSTRLEQQCTDYRERFGDDRAVAYVADLYAPGELDRVFGAIAADHRPDVLVNNAFDFSAATGFNTASGRLATSTPDQWQHAFESGLYWAVRATQLCGQVMQRRRRGSIINVASMYALVSPHPSLYEDTPYFNPPTYSAVKAGLLAFTRYVAAFWGRDGVRCNALVPGSFPNTETTSANAVQGDSEFLERLARQTLVGRVGHPSDLSGALLLLASDAGSYITGQSIVVDGGWTVK